MSTLNKELEELRAAAGGPAAGAAAFEDSAASEPNRGPDSYTQAVGKRANVNDPKTAAPQQKWFIGALVLVALGVVLWIKHSNTSAAAADVSRIAADSLAARLDAPTDDDAVSLDLGTASQSGIDSLRSVAAVADSARLGAAAPLVPPVSTPQVSLNLTAPAPTVTPLGANPLDSDDEPSPAAVDPRRARAADPSGAYRPVDAGDGEFGAVGTDGMPPVAPPRPESKAEQAARLATERAEAQAAARQLRLAELAKETERLKEGGTKMSGGDSEAGASGRDSTSESAPRSRGAGGASTQTDMAVGATVGATLIQPFSSLTADLGPVQARLTSPLRSRTGVVLPSGTVAYGAASVREAPGGGPPRVVVTFETFVTPDQRTVSDLSGLAQSLETSLIGLEGQVNRRVLLRTAKAVAASMAAVGATLGQNVQVGALGQPSAAAQTRIEVSNRLIGVAAEQIGDEGTVVTDVRLPVGKAFKIVFNMPTVGGK